MRIVFMGTPEFAVASLDILVKNGFDVVGVVTATDKPAGRGNQLQQSAVKKYALEHGLRVLQPEKLKAPGFLEELTALKPDLQVVVAFRMLPEAVWSLPPLGTINLHGSLLPAYRGAAPINWAVINGETKTGVTTFFLQHEIDTGSIIHQADLPIGNTDTAGEVHDRMMALGAEVMLQTVKEIQEGTAKGTPQDMSGNYPHAPKIFREDCKIDWNKSVDEIYNHIRGLSPYPAAWTELDGKTLKIFKALKETTPYTIPPGTMETDGKTHMRFATPDGYIYAEELHL
ncbi:methionyl-tRNA formyltransferase [soil metagenome]